MQKWEYKLIEENLTDAELNELGALGWELVTVSQSGEWGVTTKIYLKRLRSN